MKPAGIDFKAIVVGAAMRVSSGLNASCPLGTRVYSLTVWSGWWLDGLLMRCTGESDVHYIPEELKDNPGGGEDEDICAGTAGVQSMHWNVPNEAYGLVYLNITCQDNETYQFADGQTYGFWDVSRNRTISCNQGEHVQGLAYSLMPGGTFVIRLLRSNCPRVVRPAFDFWDVNRNRAISCNEGQHVQGLTCSFDYVEDSGFAYFLTDLDFVLLSSALGEHETSTAR